MYFICNALFIQKNLRVPSLCPSPFNCITRNIKRRLPYSTFFSLHLSLYPSTSNFSHTPSLCFTPFSLLSIFSHFTLFTVFIQSHSCSLFHSAFLSSFTLFSFLHSSFFSSSTLLSFFHSSFLSSLF